MSRQEGKSLARTLVLSMLLSGATGIVFEPRVLAADDVTHTVITSGGTYNSIKVKDTDRTILPDDYNGIYGVNGYSLGGNCTITMTGEKIITVEDSGITDRNDETGYNAIGIGSGVTVEDGDSTKPLIVTLTGTGKQFVVDTDTVRSTVDVIGLYSFLVTGATNTINGGIEITGTATGGNVTLTDNATGSNTTAEGYGFGASESNASNVVKGNTKIKLNVYGGPVRATDSNVSSIETTGNAGGLIAMKTATNKIEGNVEIEANSLGGEVVNTNVKVNTYSSSDATTCGLNAYGGTNTVEGNAKMTVVATGGKATITANNTNIGITAQANASSYGLSAGYGKNTIDGDAEITVKAIGGEVTATGGQTPTVGTSASAFGLYALKTGNNKILGNVKITTEAKAKQAGESFYAYSMYSSDIDSTNDLSSVGKTKTIEGDVYANDSGVNKLVLDTKGSYLQGNIVSNPDSPGDNQITVSNGAVWRPVYDNRYGTDCVNSSDNDAATKNVAANKVSERSAEKLTLNENGIIDLTWDGWSADGKTYDVTRDYRTNGVQQANKFRSLTVDNLNGSGGTLLVDSNLANNESDTLTVGSASAVTSLYVQVNYDDFYANSVKGDTVTGKALVVTDNSGKLTVTGANSEYNAKTYIVTVTQDSDDASKWNITKIVDTTEKDPTPTPANITENTKHAADSRDNVNNIWEIETNSLTKRLGDLRSMGKDTSKYDNMWAKYGHGTQQLGQGRDTEIKYNQFQLGYDKLFDRNDGKMYRGIMVSRINGDASYERGNGDTNSTTVGLYQTWLGNKGHYYDVILRYGKIDADYRMSDLSNNYSTADYNMWATTLSGEYGYRKDFGKGAYIEPSAELILGHIGSADYTTSKNMNVYLDASKHAITRLGFMTGKDFGKGNAYFKANYYHDFAGGGSVTTDTVNYENDQPKNWCELGIGGNVQLSKNANAYAEVRKLFGNLKSNVNFSVGARWSF